MAWAISLGGDRASREHFSQDGWGGGASGLNAQGIPAWQAGNDTASDDLCDSNTESTPFLALSRRIAGVTGGPGFVSRYELCDLGTVSESDFPRL